MSIRPKRKIQDPKKEDFRDWAMYRSLVTESRYQAKADKYVHDVTICFGLFPEINFPSSQIELELVFDNLTTSKSIEENK